MESGQRLRRRFGDDRGSLSATLVFVIVATMTTGLMLGFLVSRIQAASTAQTQSQLRSAVTEMANDLVAEVNLAGPDAIQVGDSIEVPNLRSMVEVIDIRAGTAGALSISLRGVHQKPSPSPRIVSARLTLTPAGLGSFTGTDETTGRPTWSSTPAGGQPLALYIIAPGALVFEEATR